MNKAEERQSNNKRKLWLLLGFLLLVILALLLLNLWEKQQGYFPFEGDDGAQKKEIEYKGERYILNENISTFLVMGLDKFSSETDPGSYNNDQQADFLMLLVMDNEKRTCTAVQINRDTMTDVNILGVAGQVIATEKKQIALSHTYGNGELASLRNTADAVAGLFYNVKILSCLSVTMDAVPAVTDMVDGVTLEVLDDFTGIDDGLIKGETVTLRGDRALTYVRTRKGLEDSTNAHRMKRQQQFVNALYGRVKEKMQSDGNFAVSAVLGLGEYTVANCATGELTDIVRKLTDYELLGIRTLEGKSEIGEYFMEFHPYKDRLTALTVELFYKKK